MNQSFSVATILRSALVTLIKTKMSTAHTEKVTNPTVKAARNFEPRIDAERLEKAFKGLGCDTSTVIEILCNRDNAQRIKIADSYKTCFGEDLKKRLIKETSGNLEKVLVGLVTPYHEYLAEKLHHAMKGVGTDESVLIELLTSLSNATIRLVNQHYQRLYKRSLESDIIGDTSGHFKRLCISLALGNRSEDTSVDVKLAKIDAQKLYDAGVGRWGTDESTFNSILVAKSFEHLRVVFQEYAHLAGHSMKDAIEREFSGDIKKGLLAIVEIVNCKSEYFSKLLYKSMKGLGTDDQTLIRILISRSEIDLGDIKTTFYHMYGKTLAEWIKGDTSGKYQKALTTIIAE